MAECAYLASMLDTGSSEQEPVECPYCPCTVPKSDLHRHYRVCESAYICAICKEVMSASKRNSHFHPPSKAAARKQKVNSKKQGSATLRPSRILPLSSQNSDELRVDCYFCGQHVAKSEIKHHLEHCKNASECPSCLTYMSKEDYRDHVQACAYSQFSLSRNPDSAPQKVISSDGSSEARPGELVKAGYYEAEERLNYEGEEILNYAGEEMLNHEEDLVRQLPQLALQDSASYGPENYEVTAI